MALTATQIAVAIFSIIFSIIAGITASWILYRLYFWRHKRKIEGEALDKIKKQNFTYEGKKISDIVEEQIDSELENTRNEVLDKFSDQGYNGRNKGRKGSGAKRRPVKKDKRNKE